MYQCPEYYAPEIEAEVGSWFEIQLSLRSNITVVVHIIYIIEGILTTGNMVLILSIFTGVWHPFKPGGRRLGDCTFGA